MEWIYSKLKYLTKIGSIYNNNNIFQEMQTNALLTLILERFHIYDWNFKNGLSVNELIIRSSEIDHAFATKGYYYFSVPAIVFENVEFKAFPLNLYDSIVNVRKVVIINSKVIEFFIPRRSIYDCRLIEFVSRSNIFNGLNDIDLIGNKTICWHLSILKISHTNIDLYTISSNNFTQMPKLEAIEFVYCGIESILDNAFQKVSSTLRSLNLEGNYLKRIPSALLQDIIHLITPTFDGINLKDNHLICDCEMDMNIRMSFTGTRYLNQSIFIQPVPCMEETISADQCDHIQRIHPKKVCLQSAAREIQYPKFQLKLKRASKLVIVETMINAKYHVWIHDNEKLVKYNSKWVYSGSRCPNRMFIKSSIRCFTFKSQNLSEPLFQRMPNSNSFIVCVVYSSFSPLQCINFLSSFSDPEVMFSAIHLFICCCITGFAIAICITIVFYKSRKEEQHSVTDEPQLR